MSDLRDAALAYMNLGLRVIVLTGKTPNVAVHSHGLKDYFALDSLRVTNSRGQVFNVAEAVEHPDTTGVGILTSYPLIVVDIDGPEGAEAWREMVAADWLPETWIAATGRGLHLYLGAPWLQTGSMKLAEKLDLKGEGGYVAAPPSLHPEGRRYEWLVGPSEQMLATVPETLAARIQTHLEVIDLRREQAATQAWVQHEQFEDGKLWPERGFEGLLKGMDDAASGNRNNFLHWAAATMAEQHASPEDFAELRERALKAGLTRMEVSRTIRSAKRLHD
jgi:hypothetical protein